MSLEDLRFDDSEVERVLKSASKKQVESYTDHGKNLNPDHKILYDYPSLVKLAEEVNIERRFVDEVLEEKTKRVSGGSFSESPFCASGMILGGVSSLYLIWQLAKDGEMSTPAIAFSLPVSVWLGCVVGTVLGYGLDRAYLKLRHKELRNQPTGEPQEYDFVM